MYVLFNEQHHQHFVHRRSRASGYQRPFAAAEHGGLAVWAHSPLYPGLGAAAIAAGRCISGGAQPRPLTRFRF